MNTTPALPRPPVTHPLRVRDFRLLWIGATVSLLGDQFYLVALPWLVLMLTGSGLALGTIMMAAAVPRAVFMLVGGAVTDRFSPRRILIGTAAARTLLVAAVAALAYWHVITLAHIYVLAFAFGLADAFTYPANSALIPSLVAPEQLPAANATMQGSAQASTIIGPAPAGIVVKAWGVAQAFFIDAISFLFIIAALWRLPVKPSAGPGPSRPRQSMWHAILEGLRYVWHDPPMRALILMSAALNFGISGPIMIGIASVAKLRLGSATALGTMFSCFSAGALAGMLLAGVVRRPPRLGVILLVVTAFLGLGMAVLGSMYHLWSIAIVLAAMGLGNGFVGVHFLTWLQKRVTKELLGRVMSVMMFGALGLIPISYAIAGALAQANLTMMFVASGAMVVAVALTAALTSQIKAIE